MINEQRDSIQAKWRFLTTKKKCENKSGVALYPGFYRKKCAFSLFITQSWGWCWSRSTIFWLEDKQILILGILNEELPIITRRWSFGVWQFFGRQFSLISSHFSAKIDLKWIWNAQRKKVIGSIRVTMFYCFFPLSVSYEISRNSRPFPTMKISNN